MSKIAGQKMKAATTPRHWRLSFSGIMSTLIILAFDLTPILALSQIRPMSAAVIIAAFLIVSFWLPSFKIIRLSLKAKELPTISGGPRMTSYHRRPES